MLNKLKALRNQAGEEGFTLIELLVVIIIIGILSAIALPLFFNQQAEGVKAGVKSDVRNTVTEISTLLVKSPTASSITSGTASSVNATTGAVVVKPVVTKDNVVTVAGDWKAYTVTGTNPALGAASVFSYVFTSADGKYTQVG